MQVSVDNGNDKSSTLALDTPDHDNRLHKTSSLLKAFGAAEKSDGLEFDADKVADDNLVAESGLTKSSSLLDKIFGSALTVNSSGANSLTEVTNMIFSCLASNPTFWSIFTTCSLTVFLSK